MGGLLRSWPSSSTGSVTSPPGLLRSWPSSSIGSVTSPPKVRQQSSYHLEWCWSCFYDGTWRATVPAAGDCRTTQPFCVDVGAGVVAAVDAVAAVAVGLGCSVRVVGRHTVTSLGLGGFVYVPNFCFRLRQHDVNCLVAKAHSSNSSLGAASGPASSALSAVRCAAVAASGRRHGARLTQCLLFPLCSSFAAHC